MLVLGFLFPDLGAFLTCPRIKLVNSSLDCAPPNTRTQMNEWMNELLWQPSLNVHDQHLKALFLKLEKISHIFLTSWIQFCTLPSQDNFGLISNMKMCCVGVGHAQRLHPGCYGIIAPIPIWPWMIHSSIISLFPLTPSSLPLSISTSPHPRRLALILPHAYGIDFEATSTHSSTHTLITSSRCLYLTVMQGSDESGRARRDYMDTKLQCKQENCERIKSVFIGKSLCSNENK